MKEIVRAFHEAKVVGEVDFVVFFRVSNEYVVLFDDANMISSKIGIPIQVKEFTDGQVPYLIVKEENLVVLLHRLDDLGMKNYKIIETQEFEL